MLELSDRPACDAIWALADASETNRCSQAVSELLVAVRKHDVALSVTLDQAIGEYVAAIADAMVDAAWRVARDPALIIFK